MRRVFRRLGWAKDVSAYGRSVTYKTLLKSPARSARDAYHAVRTYGAQARRESGVSPLAQFTRFWWLNLRYGITDDNFYRYQLYRADRVSRAPHFVQMSEAARFYRVLAARGFAREVEVLADKRRFASWCQEHGLPSVPVLVEFANGQVARDDSGGTLPAADLFSKSGSDYGGKSVCHWRYVGEGRYEARGRQWTRDEIFAVLAEESADGLMLLQTRLTNHPAVTPVAGAALSTIRVMTVRLPGQPAQVLLAVFRMGVGESVADNYAAGGIVSAVDLDAGTLGPAVRFDETSFETRRFAAHPDTGAPIAGLAVPHLGEALRLAVRAHDTIGELPCIGWDVAPLPDGPVLLEGNWNPCVKIAQLPTDVALAETLYVRSLNAHLRRIFPSPDWSAMIPLTRWNPHTDIKKLGHVSIPTPQP